MKGAGPLCASPGTPDAERPANFDSSSLGSFAKSAIVIYTSVRSGVESAFLPASSWEMDVGFGHLVSHREASPFEPRFLQPVLDCEPKIHCRAGARTLPRTIKSIPFMVRPMA